MIDYLTKDSGVAQPRIAVFYRKGEKFSDDMLEQLQDAQKDEDNRQVFNFISQPIDLSKPDFDAEKELDKVIAANVIAVFPDGRTKDSVAFNHAIAVIKADNGNRLILGSNPLYDKRAIDDSKAKSLENNPGKGLLVSVDWFPGCGSRPEPGGFDELASQAWNGPTTRIVALSYEAVQAITDRLSRGKVTRLALLEDLRNATQTVNSDVFQNKKISFSAQEDNRGDRNEIGSRVLVTPNSDSPGLILAPGRDSCPN